MPLSPAEEAHSRGCVPAISLQHSILTLNFFRFTFLQNPAPVSPMDSHTSEKLRIYVKTMGFKPIRITYLCMVFQQALWNHILNKNGDRGGLRAIGARPNIMGALSSHRPLPTLDCELAWELSASSASFASSASHAIQSPAPRRRKAKEHPP
jgi:hypothetical protein